MLQAKTSNLILSQIPREEKPRGTCQLQSITPSLVQASTKDVLGLSDQGQMQADLFLLLTLGQESCSELHSVIVLHQYRAPVELDGRISRRGKCRCHKLLEKHAQGKNPSNLTCTSDFTQEIQKNMNYYSVRPKTCALTAKKCAFFFFFFKSQAHCSC